jgi:hypothetical protein
MCLQYAEHVDFQEYSEHQEFEQSNQHQLHHWLEPEQGHCEFHSQ